MKTVIQLVDSIDYVRANCFQHQLTVALGEVCNLVQVELQTVIDGRQPKPEADSVISCLKQRTLDRYRYAVARYLDGMPVTVYDQDPWQAFMDDSPHKGAYDRIVSVVNVKTFALTTQWWVDFLRERNLPATFVRMWVLPKYCVQRPSYLDRSAIAGFVGTVHPRRQQLLDIINNAGIKTSVLRSSSLAYGPFLTELSKLRCFVHNEDMAIHVDGKELNFNTGMWVKDIEAASQGCFSIRNVGKGSDTYFGDLPMVDGKGLIRLCERIEDVPQLLTDIEKMDPSVRQTLIDQTVDYIRKANKWHETANALVMNSDTIEGRIETT